MKERLLFSVFILSFLTLDFGKAQNIQFEDAHFKAKLLHGAKAKDTNGNPIAIDANGDGEISQAEALNVYQLNIGGEQDIKSLKGIEYFTNLTVLNCYNFYSLKSLNISKNIKLQELDLSNTEIETLDLSKNINLQTLSLEGDPGLKTLDISKNIKLQNLWLSGTRIKTLDISKNVNLQKLDLHSPKIKTLDVSKNIKLEFLGLVNIGIKALDLSKNINLQELYMEDNDTIQTLDVSGNTNLTNLNFRWCTGLSSLYMKNGVKKAFSINYSPHSQNYDFIGTNLSLICCNEDEIDEVKDYMQNLADHNLLADGWQMSNLTVTSDCGITDIKESLKKK